MKRLFKYANSFWVKYSDYVINETADGKKYLQPAPKAMPQPYDPIDKFESIALDAVNVGRLCMNLEVTESEKHDAIREFTLKYGLLGIMTALPTTPRFLQYENAFFPVNHFIREESMPVLSYMDEFYPFGKLDIRKRGPGEGYIWNLEGDKETVLLGTLADGRPNETHMTFQREYAERLDWMEEQFKDWAFNLMVIFFYYEDKDGFTEKQKDFHRQSMAAFDGLTPTYHIGLMDDRPYLVWNFNSLLQGIQLMVSMMLTDDSRPIRMCKNCGKAFIARRYRDKFCSKECSEEWKTKSDF